MSFSDYTTALVTGASTGMGAAITERLAKRGLTVHAVARNEERLSELADRTGAIPHVVDLTDTAALTAVVSELKVDVLVNCAGVSRPGNLLDSSEQDIDELIDLSDRIVVLHEGRLVGVVDAADADRYEIGRLMIGAAA